MHLLWSYVPRQSLAVNIHCEFSSRFRSDSKRIRSGFESKRRESPRIHNVFAQQYGFANFGRVFTVIRCETLSWGPRADLSWSRSQLEYTPLSSLVYVHVPVSTSRINHLATVLIPVISGGSRILLRGWRGDNFYL